MKVYCWYDGSISTHRTASALVRTRWPGATFQDVCSDAGFREGSRAPEYDRPVRALPCVVFDDDSGTYELSRAEGRITNGTLDTAEATATANETDTGAKADTAKSDGTVPGGAWPRETSSMKETSSKYAESSETENEVTRGR